MPKRKEQNARNLSELRRRINREYLIRLTFPAERRRIVVGFTRFCELVGPLHAEHYATKALMGMSHAPQFRGQSGRLIVTFYPR